MLALCSMLYPTNYAKNYAGIMGAGLLLTVVSIASEILAASFISLQIAYCYILTTSHDEVVMTIDDEVIEQLVVVVAKLEVSEIRVLK